uniref:LAGLIDADG endonuclease n=1 Tax=Bipolaris cookei TaxID=74410 RepID=A0A2H4NRU9_9PLEO|nr:LAGLIDADG endonuclease [Bipolaris cookei]ATV95709.1 LAGLIDADG endonuclease [Bipolaris cookei]
MSVSINKVLQKQNTNINQSEETWLKERELELDWFSGFSEAESMFYISTTGALSFKIKLHWDDRQTLVYIKNLLSGLVNREVGVIVDSKNQHESYYIVAKFIDILDILIPLFSKYYFTTSKFLDFQCFKAAAEIRKTSYKEKRKLNKEELNQILEIKATMNSKRSEFDMNDLPKRFLSPSRLIGFIEGDGAFCIPNMIPTLSIKQHSKNIHFYMKLLNF